MEEIQKNARTLFRLLMGACALMIVVGLERPKPYARSGVIAELEALAAIPWSEYREAMEKWPGQGEWRALGTEPEPTEKWIVQKLKEELPKMGHIEVFAPLQIHGFDGASFQERVDSGSVHEIRNWLLENEGVHTLECKPSALLPAELRERWRTTFGAVAWEPGIRIQYHVEQVESSANEPGKWVARIRVNAELIDPPPGQPTAWDGRIPALELESSGSYAPGSQVQDWLRDHRPAEWKVLSAGLLAPSGTLLPGVHSAPSEVGKQTPSAALLALGEERQRNRDEIRDQDIELVGIEIPSATLSFAGPVICIALLLYLAAGFDWMKRHWTARKGGEALQWLPLHAAAMGTGLTTLALLFLIPSVAQIVIWTRVRAFHAAASDGDASGWTTHGYNEIGLVLSIVTIALSYHATARLHSLRRSQT